MSSSSSVLDTGTGGGERFLQLQDDWRDRVVVTEEYPPNIHLATERLAPLGVSVVDVRLTMCDPIPSANEAFTLILNQHLAFNPAKVASMLAPGGTFLTQQVHGLWAQNLLAIFDAQPQWPFATAAYCAPRIEDAGLTIQAAREWSGNLTFEDVGAIVYYLRASPWLVRSFSMELHLERLLESQRGLDCSLKLAF